MTIFDRLGGAVEAFVKALGGEPHHLEVQETAVSGHVDFEIKVEADPLDGGFIAICTNLPGCMSQGETVEEALENVLDAIGGVVTARLDRAARERGEDWVPEVKTISEPVPVASGTAAAPPAPTVRLPLYLGNEADDRDKVPA